MTNQSTPQKDIRETEIKTGILDFLFDIWAESSGSTKSLVNRKIFCDGCGMTAILIGQIENQDNDSKTIRLIRASCEEIKKEHATTQKSILAMLMAKNN